MSKPTNNKMIAIIFWLHFVVATLSHIFVPLMIGGVITIVLGAPTLSFWIKGLLLGMTFYSAMYALNHVTNKDGFCVLTNIENFYRKHEGLPLVKEFTPRFYKQCRIIATTVYKFIRRQK